MNKAKNNEDYLTHAFFMILSFEAVRMFDSYHNSLNTIEDLEIAYNKSQNDANKKKSNFNEGKIEKNNFCFLNDLFIS